MLDRFDFGVALQLMKEGEKVARSGWNGKGMFLFINPGSEVKVSEGRPLASAFDIGTPVRMSPYIMIKTADDELTCVPWLASQTDLLAEDWVEA
jgi:hypothetical protein